MSFHIAFVRVANSACTMPLVARNRERDMLGFTLSHQNKIRQNMPEVLLQTYQKPFFWVYPSARWNQGVQSRTPMFEDTNRGEYDQRQYGCFIH